MNENGMFARHPGSILTLDASVIPDIAAPVSFRVGINDLAVKTSVRHAQPVIMLNDRRCGHDKNNDFALARSAQKRDNAILRVVKINPLESLIPIILVPQRRFVLVSVIEMLNQTPQPIVPRQLG